MLLSVLFLLLMVVISNAFNSSCFGPISNSEFSALHDLYNATQGEDWRWVGIFSKWDFSGGPAAPCEQLWQGLACGNGTASTCAIEAILLPAMNLTGTLPASVSNFSHLRHLELGDNWIRGTLPSQLGLLTTLHFLSFSSNNLTSTIPSVLCALTHLKQLWLPDNRLEGELPTEIGLLQNLTLLDLSANYFSGHIPTELATVTTLLNLDLNFNSFSGSLPEELGRLARLELLYIEENLFSGSLPAALSGLVSLKQFYGYHNRFHGSLPGEWSSMSQLRYLSLAVNSLTGRLPTNSSLYETLYSLDLQKNHLTGTLPSQLFNGSSIEAISLSSNRFRGPFPSQFGENVVSILLTDNKLTGPLSEAVFQIDGLVFLQLGENKLTGSIPSSMNLSSLECLYLNQNVLSGTIPDAIGNLTKLTYLKLFSNYLTGPIPSSIGNARNVSQTLLQVDFGENYFTNSLPASLGYLSRLSYLYFDDNLISGHLPGAIGGASALTLFWCQGNLISGPLPSEFGLLKLLQNLRVYKNLLTGALPSELGQLSALTVFSFSDNCLSGVVPSQLSGMTSLQLFNASSNRFSGRLTELFQSASFLHLNTIDFSQNALTGPLPSELFNKPDLAVVSLYSNCFTGSIPSTICNLRKVESLVLGSVTSGSTCKERLSPFIRKFILGLFPLSLLQGSLPACVLQLPALLEVDFSGNGLTGSLVELRNDSSLQVLSLAHNLLTGTLPTSMQTSPRLASIDLTNNRISGTLTSQFATTNASDIKLSINRLSGGIPQSFFDLQQLDVLTGNVFSCPQGKLPPSDPISGTYVCGSDDLNDSIFIWFVLTLALLLVLLWKWPWKRRPAASSNENCETKSPISSKIVVRGDVKSDADSSANSMSVVDLAKAWFLRDVSSEVPMTRCYAGLSRRMLLVFAAIVVLYLVLALTTYLVLKLSPSLAVRFSTVSKQYGWVTTAAYLHGFAPASLILCYFAFSCLILVLGIVRTLPVGNGVASKQRSSAYPWVAAASQARDAKGPSLLCSRMDVLKQYALPVILQSVNLLVSLVVNAGYVAVVIASSYPPSVLFFIQSLLSVYKIIWTSCYVPKATRMMSFLSQSQKMQHEVFMHLANFILAPSIATLFTDSDCLYNAIMGQPEIVSTYTTTATYAECTGDAVVLPLFPTTFIVVRCHTEAYQDQVVVQQNPPWFYSYQCGSALLRNYIPVVFYVQVIAGVFLPVAKFCLMGYTQYFLGRLKFPKYLCEQLVGGPILSYYSMESEPGYSDREDGFQLFRGTNIVAKRILDFSILATFGLAAPILGIAIGLQMLANTIIWRLLIGRYLYGRLPDSLTDPAERQHRLGLLEGSASGGTRGVMEGLLMVILICSLFWALLTYDMTADTDGAEKGRTFAALCCVLPFVVTVLCYVLFRSYSYYIGANICNSAARMASVIGLELNSNFESRSSAASINVH